VEEERISGDDHPPTPFDGLLGYRGNSTCHDGDRELSHLPLTYCHNE